MRLRPNPGEVTRRSRQAVSQVDRDPPTNAKYLMTPAAALAIAATLALRSKPAGRKS